MDPQPKKYYEVTLAGLVFIGVTSFVLLAAVNSQANLLFWAFGVMAGGLMVSAIMGASFLRAIEVDRLTGDHAVAGENLEIHYRLVNHKRYWPCFAIRLTEARFVGPVS